MNNKNKHNRFDKAWVHRHVNDHYVHLAKKDGYRSRAAYKLLEIDTQNNLFKGVTQVVDLGCAPGSWSQVALSKLGGNGLLIGLDLLKIEPLPGMYFIQGDFNEQEVHDQLAIAINGKGVELVLSDISPSLSGVKNVDQARVAYLVELVLDFIGNYLKVGGNALIKVFHGGEFDNLLAMARNIFIQVLIKKPCASRSESNEVYLLCKNKRKL